MLGFDAISALPLSGLPVVATPVAPTVAGGYDDKPRRKKRFVVEQDGKLLVFGSARAAVEALWEAHKARFGYGPEERLVIR